MKPLAGGVPLSEQSGPVRTERKISEIVAAGSAHALERPRVLAAFLEAAGVPAKLAFAGPQNARAIPTVFPAPALLRRRLVALPTGNGSFRFLDPVSPYSSLDDLSFDVQGHTAVVLSEMRAVAFARVPALPANRSLYEETHAIDVKSDGSAECAVTAELSGEWALRSREAIGASGAAAWAGSSPRAGWNAPATAAAKHVDEPDALLGVSFALAAAGPAGAFVPPVDLPFPAGLSAENKRRFPVVLGFPNVRQFHGAVKTPAGFAATLPADAKGDFSFGSYSVSYAKTAGGATYEISWNLNVPMVAPAGWPDVARFSKELAAAVHRPIAVKKG